MDISILFKIAGIGILIAVVHQILSKAGREDQAMMVSMCGMIIANILDLIRLENILRKLIVLSLSKSKDIYDYEYC